MAQDLENLANSCKGLHVLVVEDMEPNRRIIKTYFETLGCAGDFAFNGLEAVNMVKANKYDLCLMDFHMPVMGGLQATKIIRQELKSNIWIVALTGSSTREQLQEGLHIGMNSYCMKPINLKELAKVLLSYKNRSSSLKV